jgi:hypothetical protein
MAYKNGALGQTYGASKPPRPTLSQSGFEDGQYTIETAKKSISSEVKEFIQNGNLMFADKVINQIVPALTPFSIKNVGSGEFTMDFNGSCLTAENSRSWSLNPCGSEDRSQFFHIKNGKLRSALYQKCLKLNNNEGELGSCDKATKVEVKKFQPGVLAQEIAPEDYSCYWLSNRTNLWVLRNDLSFYQCYAQDSCEGGLWGSGGGCYKWSTGKNGPSVSYSYRQSYSIFDGDGKPLFPITVTCAIIPSFGKLGLSDISLGKSGYSEGETPQPPTSIMKADCKENATCQYNEGDFALPEKDWSLQSTCVPLP